MSTVIQPYAKSTKAGQGSRESCLRILQQLVPIATAVLPDRANEAQVGAVRQHARLLLPAA